MSPLGHVVGGFGVTVTGTEPKWNHIILRGTQHDFPGVLLPAGERLVLGIGKLGWINKF